jgi:hypothetical protein
MSATGTIEEKLIEAVASLGLFRTVQSMVEKEPPKVLKHPACFVYFEGDSDDSTSPRSRPELGFTLVVVNRNLRSGGRAARGTYGLLDGLRDGLGGRVLGLPDLGPLRVRGRRIVGYDAGVISYEIRVTVRQTLPVAARQ